MIRFVFYIIISIYSAKNWAVNVTFILPDYKEHHFWYLVADAAKSAAKDSEIKLTIIHINNNRFALEEAVNTALLTFEKPDYIVFRPFQGRILKIFDLLERKQVKFITLEQVATDKEAIKVGKPLENYQYWLGEIFYNQTQASELLTNALIKEHKFKYPMLPTYITGLSGSYDAVTKMRDIGLRKSQAKNKDTHLNQIFTMNFNSKLVKDRFSNIIQRYPNTNVFWCASAQMAVEVARQLEHSKVLPNKNFVIGGFDFISAALDKVQKEEITALVGGHFLMGAKAIIQIIDNKHGINNFNQTNHFELVTKENVAEYQEFIKNKKWRLVDFSKFLFFNKPKSQPQEVNVSNLINQLTHYETGESHLLTK